MLRCKELVVDNQKFDFGELAGPHTITTSEFHPPTYTNTTYTLDICAFLKRDGDAKKDEDCPNGTRGMTSYTNASLIARLTRLPVPPSLRGKAQH